MSARAGLPCWADRLQATLLPGPLLLLLPPLGNSRRLQAAAVLPRLPVGASALASAAPPAGAPAAASAAPAAAAAANAPASSSAVMPALRPSCCSCNVISVACDEVRDARSPAIEPASEGSTLPMKRPVTCWLPCGLSEGLPLLLLL